MRKGPWLALMPSGTAMAPAEPLHPLDPPDRPSPRAALATFVESFDRAWRLCSSGSPQVREHPLDRERTRADAARARPSADGER